MKAQIFRFLDVEAGEGKRVALLLLMSFFMGVFIATLTVASQSLFLQHFDEEKDLPIALLVSGAAGFLATLAYNFLQNRIPFTALAVLSLAALAGLTAFMEFGEGFFSNPNTIYFVGFAQIIPFTFITYLVFWGTFGRLFNLRQAKRLVGTVDLGAMVASFIAFFSIPLYLKQGFKPESLYSIALASIIGYLLLFVVLNVVFKGRSFAEEKTLYKKLVVKDFLQNRYILYMSLFVVASMIAVNFVDYSFFNVTTQYFADPTLLASFISYFEMTIVIFGFLFQIVATDRIIKAYGMRVPLLINPVLILFFSLMALLLGSVFGTSLIFFMVIAVSKLFVRSLRDSLDNPTFKLYLLPIESSIRIDVQTKIEGIVTAFASLVAGGFIILITNAAFFSILLITLFTVPLLVVWFIVANRMHHNYRHTLQATLQRNKSTQTGKTDKEFTLNTVLEREVNSAVDDKVIYGLKLMEKLEPALFENALMRLVASESRTIRTFATEKIQALELQPDSNTSELHTLAKRAAGELEDSDFLSIEPDKLARLGKSVKQNDRLLAAKLLRRMIGPRTIFVLLELLRDADPRVRYEALYTARKVKRQETWPLLIELLNSPAYSHHAAAALKEAGEPVLNTLEAAFHRSGQSDLVMLRIVQIMGHIGGKFALQLLWKKADYPDKRIVKQILYSLRYINYKAEGREAREVLNLLDAEMSKTIWNLAALYELPDEKDFYFLREALQEEVRDNYDQITILLSILYDPQSVELVRENIASGNPDNIAFAMELLDLFVDPELKPKLVPLLDDNDIPEKLRELQVYYPRESYNPIQVINYILNRDYNLNNRWTKACAIYASAYIGDFRISRGLVAQMFNTDKLLQETAAWVIYNKSKNDFEAVSERLPAKDKKFLDSSIENNRLLDGLNDGFFLWVEKVMFLKQLPAFRDIQGSLLCDLADKITPLDLAFASRVKFDRDDFNSPILIVAHGEARLKHNDATIATLKRGGVYGELFQNQAIPRVTALEAAERCVIFQINLMDFYYVMANHHDLVQSLIKNITEQNEPLYTQP